MKIAKTSIALLVVQLALVSSIAGRYLYERVACPRVWTRVVGIDPSLFMRGRYLSLGMYVDGCQSTLPNGKEAQFRRDINGAAISGPYRIGGQFPLYFRAQLKVENHKLLALRLPDQDSSARAAEVIAMPGSMCDQMRLQENVDFYLSERALSPLPLKPGQELWIEVTIPPNGPPRPTQLALKDNGVWKPLGL